MNTGPIPLSLLLCRNKGGQEEIALKISYFFSFFFSSLLQFMAANGNNVAKAKYESKMPPFYYKPTFLDCQ